MELPAIHHTQKEVSCLPPLKAAMKIRVYLFFI